MRALIFMLVAPVQALHGLRLGTHARRSIVPVMQFHTRHLKFSSLKDADLCVSTVRGIAADLARWSEEDWSLLNEAPLQATVEEVPGGVCMEYFKNQAWADGSLTIVVDGTQIVWTSHGSRREEHEEVLFKLVLEEARTGWLSRSSKLAPGFYPRSSDVARQAVMAGGRRGWWEASQDDVGI